MYTYAILLRGINVGGKNKVPMTKLKSCLEEQGFENVTTYMNSGNVLVTSKLSPRQIQMQLEELLPRKFELDSSLIKVLVLTHDDLSSVIKHAPKSFGDEPSKYHSDVIFLLGVPPEQALTVFSPKAGIDRIWPGEAVIYSERLSAQRTKSRLSKIMGTSIYKSMTIRTWSTTTKLLAMLETIS